MKTIVMTYKLDIKGSSGSENFYSSLKEFSNQWLQLEIPQKKNLLKDILANRKFIPNAYQPSTEEAYVELLMLGVFINNYGSKALQSSRVSFYVLKKLWKIRNTYPRLKNLTDKLRGLLIYLLLEHNDTGKEPDIRSLVPLVNWMKATGEFNNEANYLKLWHIYLRGIPEKKANSILNIARLSAISFSEMADRVLGQYTTGLSTFLKAQALTYKYREDYIFTARKANEYYLNMFGAQVMNQTDNKRFQQTNKKVMLLPTCMRIGNETTCKARNTQQGKVCSNCFSNCNLGKTSAVARLLGIDTYIIAHTSEYKNTIKRWANQNNTGVIGVGCVLNLLGGGYMFKQLNIPAQCIPLNYSGCLKHWGLSSNAKPTSLQIQELCRIANKKEVHLTNTPLYTGT